MIATDGYSEETIRYLVAALYVIANEPNELSHEKAALQRDFFKKTAREALDKIPNT